MIQLMGGHFCTGVGYFLVGGIFGAGDWGRVYRNLSDSPGTITALRITLSILGAVGIVGLFFLLYVLLFYRGQNKLKRKSQRWV